MSSQRRVANRYSLLCYDLGCLQGTLEPRPKVKSLDFLIQDFGHVCVGAAFDQEVN